MQDLEYEMVNVIKMSMVRDWQYPIPKVRPELRLAVKSLDDKFRGGICGTNVERLIDFMDENIEIGTIITKSCQRSLAYAIRNVKFS